MLICNIDFNYLMCVIHRTEKQVWVKSLNVNNKLYRVELIRIITNFICAWN